MAPVPEKKTDDGGPAFPRQSGTLDMGGATGLSLRDYFAGQALANLLRGDGDDWSVHAIASDCYRQADAMLKARSQP